MHRISLHLAAPQRDTLLKLATRTGLPVAELIRRAIDDFVEKQAARTAKGDK
jgi:predicted transcriptional regulator